MADRVVLTRKVVTYMLGNLTGWHMVIIFAIILLLFGAPKLPGLARSVGQSLKILKTEVRTDDKDTAEQDTSVHSKN